MKRVLHHLFLSQLHRRKKGEEDPFEFVENEPVFFPEEERNPLRGLVQSSTPHLHEIWKESFSRMAPLREEVVTALKTSIQVPISAVSLFTLNWFRNYASKARAGGLNTRQLFDVIQAQLAKQFDMRTPTIVRSLARKILDRVCSHLGAVFFEEKTLSFQALDQSVQTFVVNVSSFVPIRELLWLDDLEEDVFLCAESCEIKLKHGDPVVRTFFLHITSSLLRSLKISWSVEELTHGTLCLFQALVEEEIESRLRKRSEGRFLKISKQLLQQVAESQIRPWMRRQATHVSQFLLDLSVWIKEHLSREAVQKDSSKASLVYFIEERLGRSNQSLKGRQLAYSLFVYLLQVRFWADGELSHIEKTEYGILFFLLSSHLPGDIEADWLMHIWVKEMILSLDPMMHLACAIRDFAEQSPVPDGKMSPQLCQGILYLALGYGIFHGKESFRAQLLSDTMRLTRAIRSLPFQARDPFAFGPLDGRSRVISVMHSLVEALILFFQDSHFESMRFCLEEPSLHEETSPRLTSLLSDWIGHFPGSLAWEALLSYYRLGRLLYGNEIKEDMVQLALPSQTMIQCNKNGAPFFAN
ncbi:hypothetical protein [Candidatus Similichlamydia laticola]|uniref:hypothetical protein n=1 Tax=Candidatus Similichlamydia laticola TaxID=2170265 RepID=UPI0011C06A2C|nr:hypothetical protein [Candidatus Similichlamydia laticola]